MKYFFKKLSVYLFCGIILQLSFIPLSQAAELEEATKRFVLNTHLTEKAIDIKTVLKSLESDSDPKTIELLREMYAGKLGERLPQLRLQKVKDKQFNKDVLRIFMIGKDFPIPIDIIDSEDTYARFGKEIITYEDMVNFIPMLEKVQRGLDSYERGPSRSPSSIQDPVLLPKKTNDKFLLDGKAFLRLKSEEKLEYIKKIREYLIDGEKLQKAREPAASKESVDNYLLNKFLFGENASAAESGKKVIKKNLNPGTGTVLKDNSKAKVPTFNPQEAVDSTMKSIGINHQSKSSFSLKASRPFFDGKDCIIAGHISKYKTVGDRTSCGLGDPSLSSSKDPRVKTTCPSNQVACNTTLFGYTDDGGPYCISGDRKSVQEATYRCDLASPLTTNENKRKFINNVSKVRGTQISLNNNLEIVDDVSYESFLKFQQELRAYRKEAEAICSKVPASGQQDQINACENIRKREVDLSRMVQAIEDKQNQEDKNQTNDNGSGAPSKCSEQLKPVTECKGLENCKKACDAAMAAASGECKDEVNRLCGSKKPEESKEICPPGMHPNIIGTPTPGRPELNGCVPDSPESHGKSDAKKSRFLSGVAKFFTNPKLWAFVGVAAAFWVGNKWVKKHSYCRKYNCKRTIDPETDNDDPDRAHPLTQPTGSNAIGDAVRAPQRGR